MLDQLVESRNQGKERRKFGGFMASTSVAMMTILAVGFVVSLFHQNIALAADNFEISTLVAPVEFEPKPEPVEEPKDQTEKSAASNQSKVPSRKENVLGMEESPNKIPDSISVTPSNVKARPKGSFVISRVDVDPGGSGSSKGTGRNSDSSETRIISNNAKVVASNETEDPTPPPIVKKEEVVRTITGGVVNGKATYLATPAYPAPAKSVGIKGEVKVQVLIDEDGNVVSASVVSGHPLLTQAAVKAARSSKFSPTTLSKQKVKVTGIIVYNFA